MPRKASGEPRTRIVRITQRNGDVYVTERTYRYDPEKKNTQVLHSRIIGKIPRGQTEMVPTRPKAPSGSPKREEKPSGAVSGKAPQGQAAGSAPSPEPAVHACAGMMDILEQAGRQSGVDETLFQLTEKETALQIISLARYMLVNPGETLPYMETWQLRHPLPCGDGITEDICHALFEKLAEDAALRQGFFLARKQALCAGHGGESPAIIAFDLKTVSADSGILPGAGAGSPEKYHGNKTIRLVVLCSGEHFQPLAFARQPDNLPEELSVQKALQELSVLGLEGAELITGHGFCSKRHLGQLLYEGVPFLTSADTSLEVVRSVVRDKEGEFRKYANACPFAPGIYGICVPLKEMQFTALSHEGRAAGREVNIVRPVWLYVYFDQERCAQVRQERAGEILALKALLEEGVTAALTVPCSRWAREQLVMTDGENPASVSVREEAGLEEEDLPGFFALVSDREQDKWEVLAKYRQREYLENCLRQNMEAARLRPGDRELPGQLFVQFVSLCYREFLAGRMRQAQKTLGVPNGDPDHDAKDNLDAEKALLAWMNRTPLDVQLQWFDTQEAVSVPTPYMKKRQSPENTARDRLYLQRMGLVAGKGKTSGGP